RATCPIQSGGRRSWSRTLFTAYASRPLERLLEVAAFLGAVTSYPQLLQDFGIHRWNLEENGASHNGHLILPLAKVYDTRSQGMATTASTKASAVQTKTRRENIHGNIQ